MLSMWEVIFQLVFRWLFCMMMIKLSESLSMGKLLTLCALEPKAAKRATLALLIPGSSGVHLLI